MDDLEVAILCLYGTDSTISKGDAQNYCQNFQNSENCWRYCIDKFLTTNKLEVKFFCIHVITEKVATLKIEDMLLIKNSLFSYLEKQYITDNDDSCVINKIVQLYLLLIEFLYPAHANDVFKFLINLITTGTELHKKCLYITFFLKLMNAFDMEYIQNVYSKRNVQIVTAIKEHIKQNDLNILIECFYYIMNLNLEEQSPLSIVTLSKYIAWIDINYVANEKILSFIYQCLTSINFFNEAAFSFLTALIKKGMLPINKIQFIETVNIQGVIERLPKVIDVSFEVNKKFLVKKGEFVNHVCIELVDAIAEINKLKDYQMNIVKYTEMCNKAANILFVILPHVLEIFAVDNFHVASTVEKFFSLFFTKYKTVIDTSSLNNASSFIEAEKKTTELINVNAFKIPGIKLNQFIHNLICTTVNKFQCPEYIEEEYDEEDEEVINFFNFRENVEKLYQRLILFDKLKTIEIIKNAIRYVNEKYPTLKWNSVESTLHAFYIIAASYGDYKSGASAATAGTSRGETSSDAKNNAVEMTKGSKESGDKVDYNGLLHECLMELLKNKEILNTKNYFINQNLMEIFQRLSVFFVRYPNYVEFALHLYVTNGIRSDKNKTVKCALHNFKKFLKHNCSVISNYLKDILQLLESYLEIPCVYQNLKNVNFLENRTLSENLIKDVYNFIYMGKTYTYEEQIDLYEIVGIILLHHDAVPGKKNVQNNNCSTMPMQQTSAAAGSTTNTFAANNNMAGLQNDANAQSAEQIIEQYKERILYFKGLLNKLLEHLTSIKNVYLSSPATHSVTMCLSFMASIIIKCIGALCKNINVHIISVLLSDLDNTLGIIITEALELFYSNYIVRDSVLYTYRILSGLFKDLSLNYTIKILPFFYNVSYEMIISKLQKNVSRDAMSSDSLNALMNTPTYFQMNPSVNIHIDNAKDPAALNQEELKYLFNELNELSVLVCHLISTYKEKCIDAFIHPYIQNIIQIHMNIWKRINVQSMEMQREQNSVLSPILLIAYNIAFNIPNIFHDFLAYENIATTFKQFCEMFMNDDVVKNKLPEALTSLLIISLNYNNTNDVSICYSAAQIFSLMLNNATCMANSNEILKKYPIVQIIEVLCVTLKSLNYNDPKQKKISQEILNIFRLFCGFKVNANCLPQKIIEHSQVLLQNSLVSLFKNNPSDIGIMLNAINSNNHQQFRQVLLNLVV